MDLQLQQTVSQKLLTIEYRKRILQEISGWENKERKYESFKQFEVYHERSRQFVLEYLRSQFNRSTVEQMPIVDSINISKRVVEKQSTLYTEQPEREFSMLDAEQVEELNNLYKDLGFNQKLAHANGYYKLQQQTCLWLVPVNNKLKLRCLLPHQYDVIPNEEDPEIADAYIINTFDRSFFFRPSDKGTNGANEAIADQDDWRTQNRKFLVWTRDFNFIMNGKGEFISEVLPNQIGMLPFVDVSEQKDMEFFIRGGRALTDFAVQFCGALSDLYNVVKMQGWAVGYLIAPPNVMPEELTVGPNVLLRLPTDPNNSGERPEFGYASPNADIAGSIQFLETLVALFLTSKGLDAKAISTKMDASNFSSGVERLLAMLEVFEASKEDFAAFTKAEQQIYELIKKWNNLLLNSDSKVLSFAIPDDSKMTITYKGPEMLQSESEKFDLIDKKYKAGYITFKEAVMQDRGVDEEVAERIIEEIEEEKLEKQKKQMDALMSPMEGEEDAISSDDQPELSQD